MGAWYNYVYAAIFDTNLLYHLAKVAEIAALFFFCAIAFSVILIGTHLVFDEGILTRHRAKEMDSEAVQSMSRDEIRWTRDLIMRRFMSKVPREIAETYKAIEKRLQQEQEEEVKETMARLHKDNREYREIWMAYLKDQENDLEEERRKFEEWMRAKVSGARSLEETKAGLERDAKRRSRSRL